MARMEEPEEDAETTLVDSLRAQLDELGTQVTQLNSKLVTSYNRISDLEDDLHESKDSLSTARTKLQDLEEKVGSHQNALLTGSLVNREEITAELSRLMEKATEEASQRGLAEEEKNNIEREIGDLSESLFAEANKMVLTAKGEQAESERRMGEMGKEVKMAESAVAALQAQLQEKIILAQAAQEERDYRIAHPDTRKPLMSDEVSPYTQFLGFLDHIRTLKLTANSPTPTLTSLLSQPFVARIVSEDSDPTLRLDTAPSLNWITRRTLLGLVYTGQLDILPTQFTSSLYNLSGSGSNCALCGLTIQHPSSSEAQPQLHTFRLPPTAASFPGANSALSNTSSFTSGSGTMYLLCSSGYCLQRLRTTITLWAFIRSNLIDHCWKLAPVMAPPPVHSPNSPPLANGIAPPAPPKKKNILPNLPSSPGKVLSVGRISMGGLWGALKRTNSSGSVDETKKRESVGSPNVGEKVSLKEMMNSSPPSPPSRVRSPQTPGSPPPLPKRPSQVSSPVSAIGHGGVSPGVRDRSTSVSDAKTATPISPKADSLTQLPPRTRRNRSGTVSAPPPTLAEEDKKKEKVEDIKEEEEEPSVQEKVTVDQDTKPAEKPAELISVSSDLEKLVLDSPGLEEIIPLSEPVPSALDALAVTTSKEEEATSSATKKDEKKDDATQQADGEKEKENVQQDPVIKVSGEEETKITDTDAKQPNDKPTAPSSVPPSPTVPLTTQVPPGTVPALTTTSITGAPPPIPRRAARRAAPKPPGAGGSNLDAEKGSASRPTSVVDPPEATKSPEEVVKPEEEVAKPAEDSVKSEPAGETTITESDREKEIAKDEEPAPEKLKEEEEKLDDTIDKGATLAEEPKEVKPDDSKVEETQPADDDQMASDAEPVPSGDTVPLAETSTATETLQAVEVMEHDKPPASEETKEVPEHTPSISEEGEKVSAEAKVLAVVEEQVEPVVTPQIASPLSTSAPIPPAIPQQPADRVEKEVPKTPSPPPPPPHSKPTPMVSIPKSGVPSLPNGESMQAQTMSEESWEKKTYQEIVRLRLDMFWARVGVVNDAGGDKT